MNFRTHWTRTLRLIGVVAVLVFGPMGMAQLTDRESSFDPSVEFSHDVVPILRNRCFECHGGENQKGDFSINTRESILSSQVIEVGESDRSELFKLISSSDPRKRMPPQKRSPLDANEIETLRAWIDQGLPWEPGYSFGKIAYEAPLEPRRVTLPAPIGDRSHPIDRIIDNDLKKRGLNPIPRADNETLLRRLHLDVIGLLPNPNEFHAFSDDRGSDKIPKAIDALLARREDYAEHWLTFWNDLLRNDYVGTGYIDGGRKQISDWLYSALKENWPYDRFVKALIAPTNESEGFMRGIKWRGKVNSSQTQAIQFAQNVSQVFLGINMKCASCHDSFVDSWKLDDAYGLAAIYSETPLEIHRCDVPTGRIANPTWIFRELGDVNPSLPRDERLVELADLVTHPENGRFTRTLVNRVWHRLMGRGIVEPVDAMHTQPWSEDLLDHLATYFSDQDFDIAELIRWIVSSEAYLSQSQPPQSSQEPHFSTGSSSGSYSGPWPRRMTAEQFLDAVWSLTEANPSRADFIPRDKTLDTLETKGHWIWSYASASASAPAGETVAFLMRLDLPTSQRSARIVITCDNEYRVFVNSQLIHSDNDWPTVEVLDLSAQLNRENMEVVIVSRNAGLAPNPAGLFAEIHLVSEDGVQTEVGTDESWQWAIPPMEFAIEDIHRIQADRWSPAEKLDNPSFLGRDVNDRLRHLIRDLSSPPSTEPAFVRASMQKSDLLMRSLGRPNREQVVTTRPESLSTLQAIDLANGEILADVLERGAQTLFERDWESSEHLIRWIYHHALSRNPSDIELNLLSKAVQTPNSLEDVLWVIIMLPEFQWIR